MSTRSSLFGCQIDCIRMPEAVTRVFELLDGPESRCQFVVTPNVNHVVMLPRHAGLRQAYDDAALVLADGMPIVLAGRLLGHHLPERVSGADLVPALFEAAPRRGGLRVYLLGAGPGVAEEAATRIHERWPSVEVVGTYSPPMGFENDPAENARILAKVAACRLDVLVVGLGAPKQELWVHRHQDQLQAGVALCVGASIDFLAGHKSRAPRWMQTWGLEWVHRMVTEPRRLTRRYVHDGWYFLQILWREARRGRSADASCPPRVASSQELTHV